jgi:GST-like protein
VAYGRLGPGGQNHHFAIYAPEKLPYAIERYVKETSRLYGVLNKRLRAATSSSASSTPSPTWRATLGHPERQGQNMDDFPT